MVAMEGKALTWYWWWELYAGLLRTAEPEYLKSIYLLMLSKTR
jgi:hypothetical protein